MVQINDISISLKKLFLCLVKQFNLLLHIEETKPLWANHIDQTKTRKWPYGLWSMCFCIKIYNSKFWLKPNNGTRDKKNLVQCQNCWKMNMQIFKQTEKANSVVWHWVWFLNNKFDFSLPLEMWGKNKIKASILTILDSVWMLYLHWI